MTSEGRNPHTPWTYVSVKRLGPGRVNNVAEFSDFVAVSLRNLNNVFVKSDGIGFEQMTHLPKVEDISLVSMFILYCIDLHLNKKKVII